MTKRVHINRYIVIQMNQFTNSQFINKPYVDKLTRYSGYWHLADYCSFLEICVVRTEEYNSSYRLITLRSLQGKLLEQAYFSTRS